MTAVKKKKSSATPVWLIRLTSLLRGPGRPIVWTAVAAGVLLGGWYLVWREVRQRVLSSSGYVVGPQQVEITPLPKWVHVDVADIRAEAFRNASLDAPLSIMDDDLAERIADAFSLHPWVAKVRQVTKHHPARVKVELVYRRPVCMVEVHGKRLPVDVHGVLLPPDHFSPLEAAGYPRLVGVNTVPMGTVGEYWGDVRVVDGAEIAEALGPVWDQLGLWQIMPSPPGETAVAQEHTYTLLTRGGTRISWGHAPSADAPGEPSAAAKVARLQECFDRYGTLEGRGGPREWDLQSLRPSARPKR